MKKLILIFALTTTLCKAQTIPVTITNVTDTVNSGDSIKICFVYHSSANSTMARIQLWTASYLQDCLYVDEMTVMNLPTCGTDTAYIKVKINSSMGFGNGKVYSNSTPYPGYKKFYIKNSTVMGIKKYDKNSTIIKTEFYDIYGKENPSQNEVFTIKLTTYSNGYQKKEKIISQSL
jgi:hypothetical protein